MEFQKFNKISRLSRDIIITEKIDGTNSVVFIYNANDELHFPYVDESKIVTQKFINDYALYEKNKFFVFAGSRKRWITSKKDNYNFAKWVKENGEELLKLGEGRHYGEWWGRGIQRNYDMNRKVFSLFNVKKWSNDEVRPYCCNVVPILYEGMFNEQEINKQLVFLDYYGSKCSPGFKNAEGIIIYHTASGKMFKKTIKNDEKPKSVTNENI